MKFHGIVLAAVATVTATMSLAGSLTDPGGSVRTSTAVFAWATPNTKLHGNAQTQVGKTKQLDCAAKTGCVVFLQAAVEIIPTADNTTWSICAKVDGQLANPMGCFFGPSSDTAGINTGSVVYQGTAQVAKGTHAIRYFVFVSSKADLSTWHEVSQILH